MRHLYQAFMGVSEIRTYKNGEESVVTIREDFVLCIGALTAGYVTNYLQLREIEEVSRAAQDGRDEIYFMTNEDRPDNLIMWASTIDVIGVKNSVRWSRGGREDE